MHLGLGDIGIYCHDISCMAKSITVVVYIMIFYFVSQPEADYTIIECIILVDRLEPIMPA